MALPTPTDPAHWRQVNALLTTALALAPQAREAWLEGLPEADRPLAPLLRRLLARADEPADAFMEQSAPASVFNAQGAETLLEQPGAEVGPYRLLRELGSGGMGRVWLAERTDGSLQRQVALKLPRTGWARGVAERLTQERDALAALEHPNIARLYDAGTVQGGRPYIAMEHVDGVSITDYLRARPRPLRERLALFLQVAGAVAFAHAQLIVHRDIKPQNILVSEDGVAHLLDFGAAKLLGRDDDVQLTRQVGGAMSPDYASPEQIRGDRITVATDVYSLGVLLFELLTGSRPYRLQRLGGAALEDAILKADIPRASGVATLDPAEARQLRGDLDAILAKAMRRDPTRRYASVQAFADDIERHLAGEPVLAQPPSRGYLIRKFVRRHRFGVAAATAVALALGIGTAVSMWQAGIARAETARAARVKEFVASIFTQAAPKSGVGGTVTAADLLGVAVARLDRELADDPATAAELGLLFANSYFALGLDRDAEPILRATVVRAGRALGPDHPITLDAKAELASAIALRDPTGSLEMLQALLPSLQKGYPANAPRAARALRYQSFALAKLNRREQSYSALRQAIGIAERYLGRDHEETIYLIGMLSNTEGRFGDREAQLVHANTAVARATLAFGARRPHNSLTAAERFYADALRENDRPADAVPILRRVVADQRALDGATTLRVRNAMLQLGNALLRIGAAAEALTLIREAVALERAQNPTETDDRRAYSSTLAEALALGHRIDEALALDVELDAMVQRLGVEPPASAVSRHLRRARLLVLHGRPDEAAPLLEVAERLALETNEDQQFQVRLARAHVSRTRGELAQAESLLRSLRADPRLAQQRLGLRSNVETEFGLTLLDQNRIAQAVEPLRQCAALFARAQVQPSVRVADCLLGVARLNIAQGRGVEAQRTLQPLLRSWESVNPGSPWHGEALYWLSRAQRVAGDLELADRTLRRARELLAPARTDILRRLT